MKVTVILTVYNIRKIYLTECLDSLAKQTLKDFEILIIDDCSKDDYSWTKSYPKVRYIRNEVNLGMNKSVNKAFSLCNSDYIVRLGSDDIFDKNLLKKESEYLDNNPKYIGVCCDIKRFGAKNTVTVRPQTLTINCDLRQKPNLYGYGGGMMFRSSALSKCSIDEYLKMCEDFDFHIQLLKLGDIHGINESLYFYRIHQKSLCHNISRTERLSYLDYIYNKHKKDSIKNIKALVSIVILVYNTKPAYLKECLNSVYKQTYKNYEIILVNDGSTKFNYSPLITNNIKYIVHDTNQGISKSLNEAFEYCTGEYIIRLDSDDIWENNILEKYVNYLNNSQNVAICCDIHEFGARFNVIKRPDEMKISNLSTVQSCKGYGYAPGLMFRASVLGTCHIDETLVICEDFDFHVQLLKLGDIHTVHECLVHYRKHIDSITRQFNRIKRYNLIVGILQKHGIIRC